MASIYRVGLTNVIKMASNTIQERIKLNSHQIWQKVEHLRNEIDTISSTYNTLLEETLSSENASLASAVVQAKKQLIDVEIKNGIKQIPLPNQPHVSTSIQKPNQPHVSTSIQKPNQPHVSTAIQKPQMPENKQTVKQKAENPKKEKKDKPFKENCLPEPSVDIGRLDLRIGKILDVQKHPDADSLYVLKIDCGEDKPRTVCSGLVKFVPMDELANREVVALCNLKPVKMRGITSEAMVMCASSPENVEVLIPPHGSQPGDPVYCDGYTRQPDAIMNPKKKIFETVAPDLHTNDALEACYKATPLIVLNKGKIVAKSLKNVAVK